MDTNQDLNDFLNDTETVHFVLRDNLLNRQLLERWPQIRVSQLFLEKFLFASINTEYIDTFID
ncbi:MAG: hypothetical protein PHD46_01625 [Eubacteriales bacterium]|nr:hypothetical protein [Eubacteriales bacterium]MDD4421716.1 hypothetical protein [Eubacteriales bacterium]